MKSLLPIYQTTIGLTLLVLFVSCYNSKHQPHDPLEHFASTSEYKLSVKRIIDLGKYNVYRPTTAIKYNSEYYIRDGSSPRSIKLYNDSKGTVRTLVNQGNGPMEMNSIDRIKKQDTAVVAFDHTRKKLYQINNPESGEGIIEIKHYSMEERPFIVDFHNDMMLASGLFQSSWVNLYNGENLVLALDFPIFDVTNALSALENSILYLSTHVRFKPDGSAFALAAINEGVLSVYRNIKGDWNNVVEWKYFPPIFKQLNMDETGTPLAFTKDNRIAFYALDCTDKFIYTLYSGKQVGLGALDAYLCQHVLVYDWNGNPVKHYYLDKPLHSMGVDEKAGILYGIGYDPEGCIIEYKLN